MNNLEQMKKRRNRVSAIIAILIVLNLLLLLVFATTGDNENSVVTYSGEEVTESEEPTTIAVEDDIKGDVNIADVATGANFTIALDSEGRVWAWGQNEKGQLGNGTLENSLVKTAVLLREKQNGKHIQLSGIKQISAGEYHAAALTNDGEVYVWGYNYFGQAESETLRKELYPKKISLPQNTKIKQIACGADYTALLTREGKILGIGDSSDGQLGYYNDIGFTSMREIDGNTGISGIEEISAGTNHMVAITNGGELLSWGDTSGSGFKSTNVKTVTLATTPVDVKAGDTVTIALLSDGTIYTGSSTATSLTQVALPSGVTIPAEKGRIGVINKTYYFIDSENHLYSWGQNTVGQTGVGNNSTVSTPTQLVTESANGIEINNEIHKVASSPVSGISYSGGTSTNGAYDTGYAINKEGYVLGWGYAGIDISEEEGQNNGKLLGNGTRYTANYIGSMSLKKITGQGITINVGEEEDLVSMIKEGGYLRGGRVNLYKEDTTSGIDTLKIEIANEKVATYNKETGKILGIRAGRTVAIISTEQNSVMVSIKVKDPNYFTEPKIENNDKYSIALKADGTVWAWGYNTNLGIIDPNATGSRLTTPTHVLGLEGVKDISAGPNYVLVLFADGTVWAWGQNQNGELGNGTEITTEVNSITTEAPVLTQVKGIDSNVQIVQISAGDHSAVALDNLGQVWGWGANYCCALGLGDSEVRYSAEKIDISALEGKEIKQIESGVHATYILTTDGYIYGAGHNGRIGNITGTVKKFTKITNISGVEKISAVTQSSNVCYVLAVTSSGKLWGFGDGNYGTGKYIEGVSNVIDVVATGYRNGAIFTYVDGTVGIGEYLENPTTNRNRVVRKLKAVGDTDNFTETFLITGGSRGSYTVAKEDGTVWTMGDYYYGQLGNRQIYNSSSVTSTLECISFDYVSLDKHEITIKEGNTEEISAQYNYGFNLVQIGSVDVDLEYTSLDTSIATIENGVITGVKSGKTYIEGKYTDRDIIVRCTVNVVAQEEVTTPKVSSGYRHTIALKADGTVWGWGYDAYGAMGKNCVKIQEPQKIALDNKYIDISAGNDYTVLLDTAGQVWAMGYNANGQLGDGTTINSAIPVKVLKTNDASLNNIVKIETRNNTVFALDKDGKLYIWGANADKYAKEVYTQGLKVIDVEGNAILTEDGRVWKIKNSSSSQTVLEYIEELRDIVEISSAGSSSLTSGNYMALDGKGNVYTWATSSSFGFTGNETNVPTKLAINVDSGAKIVDIEAGVGYALLRDSNGNVYSYGKTVDLLGRRDGLTTAQGRIPTKIDDMSNIESMATTTYSGNSSYYRSFAVTKGGAVFGFGGNGTYSLLGNIDTKTTCYYEPTLVGGSYAVMTVNGEEKSKVFMEINESANLQANLTSSFRLRLSKLEDSESEEFEWTVFNKEIANVGESTNAKNTLTTTEKLGEAIIVATHKDTGVSARLYVEVKKDNKLVSPKIESAGNHTIALKADGTVWGWGNNSTGLLGTAQTGAVSEPQKAQIDAIVTDIATSSTGHTLMLTMDGSVYSCGYNYYGQLGYATYKGSNQYTPRKIEELTDIVKIAVGENYSLALDKYGRLWFFGRSSLSVNERTYTLSSREPMLLKTITNIDIRGIIKNAIDITNEYILTKDGEVYSINLSLTVPRNTTNGNVVAGTKVIFDTDERIVKVTRTSGTNCNGHTAFLTENGNVYSIGLGTTGQLGNDSRTTVNRTETPVQVVDANGLELTNIVDIYTGDTHTIAIDKDGTVYTWGSNTYGELRNEEVNPGTSYARAHIVATDSRINKGILVSAGNKYSIVVNEDGNVYAWGLGTSSQLGNGLQVNKEEAVRVGLEGIQLDTNHVTLKENGEPIEITGENRQLNLIYDPEINITATKVNTNIATVEILGEEDNIIKITPKNAGKTNIITTSKDNSNAIVDVTVLPENADIAEDVNLPEKKIVNPMTVSGNSHTVILKSDGTVWAYGDNTYGQTTAKDANGNKIAYSDKVTQVTFPTTAGSIVYIAAGDNFSLAVDTKGDVYAWGYKIGYTSSTSATVFNEPVNISSSRNIVKVVAGTDHSLALSKDGKVYAWGLNSKGALGINSTSSTISLTRVDNIGNAIDISAGKDHSMILTSSGDVYTAGNNIYGQLGVERITNRLRFERIELSAKIVEISAGNGTSTAIDEDGNLWVWGNNKNGQLGLGITDKKIFVPTKCTVGSGAKLESVSAGDNHVQVVTTTGELYVTGSNAYGQLGLGSDEKTVNGFTKVESLGNNVMSSNAGTTYSTVIDKTGAVYGFGDYNHGNLSRVSISNSKIPVKISRDSASLDETEITVKQGSSYTIRPTGMYKLNVYHKDMTSFTYNTANEEIATVSEDGKITGVKVGTTRINITDDTDKVCAVIVKVIPTNASQSPVVAGGDRFAVVTNQNGTVHLFGSNEKLINKNIPKIANDSVSFKTISAGENFIVGISNDRTVWAYGDNTYAQLGSANISNPTQMNRINTNYIKDVVQISAGKNHVIALNDIGMAYVWGDNSNGQLGITGTVTQPTVIRPVLCGIISVSAGGNYSSIVDETGKVYILSNGTANEVVGINNAIKVATGTEATIVLTRDGKVYTVNNSSHIASPKIANKDIVDIAVSNDSFMCLNSDQTICVWGNNTNGQLGTGNKNSVNTVKTINTDNAIFTIGAGNNNTYYISTEGEVYAAGLNTSGELGNGTSNKEEAETYELSATYTKVGDRTFKIKQIQSNGTEKDVSGLKIAENWQVNAGGENVKGLVGEANTKTLIIEEGKQFNVFGKSFSNADEYDFRLEGDNIGSLTVTNKITTVTATGLGEMTLIAENLKTTETQEVKIIVVTEEELRISDLYVTDSKNKTYLAQPKSQTEYVVNSEGSTATGTLTIVPEIEGDIVTVKDEEGNDLQVNKVNGEFIATGINLDKIKQTLSVNVTTSDGKELNYTIAIRKEVILKVDNEVLAPDEYGNYTKFVAPDATTATIDISLLNTENIIVVKDSQGKEVLKAEGGKGTTTVNIPNEEDEFTIQIVDPEGNVVRNSTLTVLKSSLESIYTYAHAKKEKAIELPTKVEGYNKAFYLEVDESNDVIVTVLNIINENIQSIKIGSWDKAINKGEYVFYQTKKDTDLETDIELTVLDPGTGTTYIEKYKLYTHRTSANCSVEKITLTKAGTTEIPETGLECEKISENENAYEVILHNGEINLEETAFEFIVKMNSKAAKVSLSGSPDSYYVSGEEGYKFAEISREILDENKCRYTIYTQAENGINADQYTLTIYKQSEDVSIESIIVTSQTESAGTTTKAEKIEGKDEFIGKALVEGTKYEISIKLNSANATIKSIELQKVDDENRDLSNVLTLKNGANRKYVYTATEDLTGRTIKIMAQAEYAGATPVEYTLKIERIDNNIRIEDITVGEDSLELYENAGEDAEPIEINEFTETITGSEADSISVKTESNSALIGIYDEDPRENENAQPIRISENKIAEARGEVSIPSLGISIGESKTVYVKVTSEDQEHSNVKKITVKRLSNNANIETITFAVNGNTYTLPLESGKDSNNKVVKIDEKLINGQPTTITVTPEDSKAKVSYEEEGATSIQIDDWTDVTEVNVQITSEDETIINDYTIDIHFLSANTEISKKLVNVDKGEDFTIKADEEFEDKGNDRYSVIVRGHKTLDLVVEPKSEGAKVELAIVKESDVEVTDKKYVKDRITVNTKIITEVEVKVTAENKEVKTYVIEIIPDTTVIESISVEGKYGSTSYGTKLINSSDILSGNTNIKIDPNAKTATINLTFTATNLINGDVEMVVNGGVEDSDGNPYEQTISKSAGSNKSLSFAGIALLDNSIEGLEELDNNVKITFTTKAGRTEEVLVNISKGSTDTILDEVTVTGANNTDDTESKTYESDDTTAQIAMNSEDTRFNITAKTKEGTYEIYKVSAEQNSSDVSLADVTLTSENKITDTTEVELGYAYKRFVIVVTSDFGGNTRRYELYAKKINKNTGIEDLTITINGTYGEVAKNLTDFGTFNSDGSIDIVIPKEANQITLSDLILANSDATAQWSIITENYTDATSPVSANIRLQDNDVEKAYIKVITEDGSEKVYTLNIETIEDEFSLDNTKLHNVTDNVDVEIFENNTAIITKSVKEAQVISEGKGLVGIKLTKVNGKEITDNISTPNAENANTLNLSLTRNYTYLDESGNEQTILAKDVKSIEVETTVMTVGAKVYPTYYESKEASQYKVTSKLDIRIEEFNLISVNGLDTTGTISTDSQILVTDFIPSTTNSKTFETKTIVVPNATSEIVLNNITVNDGVTVKDENGNTITDGTLAVTLEDTGITKAIIRTESAGLDQEYVINIRKKSTDASILSVKADDKVTDTLTQEIKANGDTEDIYVIDVQNTKDPEMLITLKDANAKLTNVSVDISSVTVTEIIDNSFTLEGVSAEEHDAEEDKVDTKVIELTVTVTAEDGNTADHKVKLVRKHTQTEISEIEYLGDNEEKVTIDTLEGEISSITNGITLTSVKPVCSKAKVYAINDNSERVSIADGIYYEIPEGANKEIKLIVVSEYGNEEEHTLTIRRKSGNINVTNIKVNENEATLTSENIYDGNIKVNENFAIITVIPEDELAKIVEVKKVRILEEDRELVNGEGEEQQRIHLDGNQISVYGLPEYVDDATEDANNNSRFVEVTFVMTAEDESITKEYTLKITRQHIDNSIPEIEYSYIETVTVDDEPTSENKIEKLELSTEETKEIVLSSTVENINVAEIIPSCEYADIQVTVDDKEIEMTEEGFVVALTEENTSDGCERTIKVIVTAEDGTKAEYTFTVTRMATNASLVKVLGNGIKAVKLTDAEEETGIEAIYRLGVGKTTQTVNLEAISANKNATVEFLDDDKLSNTIAQKAKATGVYDLSSVPEDQSETSVLITVTPEDETKEAKTYKLIIRRLADRYILDEFKIEQIVSEGDAEEPTVLKDNDEHTADFKQKSASYFAYISGYIHTDKCGYAGEYYIPGRHDTCPKRPVYAYDYKYWYETDKIEIKTNWYNISFTDIIPTTPEMNISIQRISGNNPHSSSVYDEVYDINTPFTMIEGQDVYFKVSTVAEDGSRNTTRFATGANSSTNVEAPYVIHLYKKATNTDLETILVDGIKVLPEEETKIYQATTKVDKDNVTISITGENNLSGDNTEIISITTDNKGENLKDILGVTKNVNNAKQIEFTISKLLENLDSNTDRIIKVDIAVSSEDTTIPVQVYKIEIERIHTDIAIDKILGNGNNIPVDKSQVHYNYENKNVSDKDIYTQYLDAETTEMNLDVIAKSTKATVQISSMDGTELATGVGSAQYALTIPTEELFTRVKVKVTLEDKTQSKEYEVWFIRKSDDTEIAELYVDGKIIKPGEDGDYKVDLEDRVNKAVIRLVPRYKYANASVNLQPFEWQETTVTIEDVRNAVIDDQGRLRVELKVQIPKDQSISGENKINKKYLYINTVSENNQIKRITTENAKDEITPGYMPSNSEFGQYNTYTILLAGSTQLREAIDLKIEPVKSNTKLELYRIEDDNSEEFLDNTEAGNLVVESIPVKTQGITVFKVKVTSEAGTAKDYYIKVVPRGSQATLERLTIKGIDIELEEGVYKYQLLDLTGSGTIYALATANKNNSTSGTATVDVYTNGSNKKTSSNGEITVNNVNIEDTNNLTVVVTSPDGSVTNTYEVDLKGISDNTELEKVSYMNEEEVIVEKVESEDENYIGEYEIVVDPNRTSIDISIVAEDEAAMVTVEEIKPEKAINVTKDLSAMNDDIVLTITVTAESMRTANYKLTIKKPTHIVGKVTNERLDKDYSGIEVKVVSAENPEQVIATVKTKADGSYQVPVTSDSYSIIIKEPGYLKYTMTDINADYATDNYIGVAHLVAGEVTADEKINLDDLVRVNKLSREKTALDDTNSECDFNKDGIIDDKDIDILNANYSREATAVKYERTIEIEGEVLDALNGDAKLPNVKVKLKKTVKTDDEGKFTMDNIGIGNYTLVVTDASTNKTLGRQSVSVKEGSSYTINDNVITITKGMTMINVTVTVNNDQAIITKSGEKPEVDVTLPEIIKSTGIATPDGIEFKVTAKDDNLSSITITKGEEIISTTNITDGSKQKEISKIYVPTNSEFGSTNTFTITVTDKSNNTVTKELTVTDNVIRTVDNLNEFATSVNSGNSYKGETIILATDLTVTITPIGTSDYPFKGKFDGNGKVITLTLNASSNDIGLFGYTDGATISNLGIVGNISSIKNSNIGGIVGCAKNTTIENCYNTATVTGKWYVGGIAGTIEENSIIKNCYNSGNVTGARKVGGIVGRINSTDGTIENCYNIGNIEETNTRYSSEKGEIVGSREANLKGGIIDVGIVTNCYGKTTKGIGINSQEVTSTDKNQNQKMIDSTKEITDVSELLTALGAEFKADFDDNINGGYPILKWQTPAVQVMRTKSVKKVQEVAKTEIQLPINAEYEVTYEYGIRTDPITGKAGMMHYGIDIAANNQTPILAIADGTVTFAGESGGYGYCVEIEHEINGEKVYSFYAHLSRIDVTVNEKVAIGTQVGLEGGKPGEAGAGSSTGAHLHFEMRKISGEYSSAVNPRNYFEF